MVPGARGVLLGDYDFRPNTLELHRNFIAGGPLNR